MKKLFCFILAAAMALGMCACSQPESPAETPSTTQPTTAPTEPTPTEPKPTEPEPTEPAPTEPSAISNDWRDFSFRLEGHVYRLPCDFSEFAENGWTLKYFYTDLPLEPYSSRADFMQKDGLQVQISLVNPGDQSKAPEDCLVDSISIYEGFYGHFDFEVAKGISVGCSSRKVLDAFGDAQDETWYGEGDDGGEPISINMLRYETDVGYYQSMSLHFSWDDALEEIHLINYVILDELPVSCEHQYAQDEIAATCTTDGRLIGTCIHCGDSYSETTAALNHDYISGKCSNCGHTKSVTVNGSFNNWNGNDMVWTEEGYTFSVTLEAGTYMFKVIKDGTWLGNNGEIQDTTTATSDIGWEFTSWGDDCALVATGGTYNFTFNFDTNFLVIEFVHTHAYTAGTVVEPTCTEKGYTVYTCSGCNDSYTADEVAALGHSYETVVTAPTCTNVGYTTYTCATCGDSYVADEVAALGHTWVDADCDTAKTCSVCGATEGSALGHASVTYSFVNNTHTFTCTVCGEVAFTKAAASSAERFGLKGASPVLSDDIVMVYETFIPAGFEKAYMVFEFNGETTVVTESEYVASTGRTCFRFPGLNPQKMGDNIHATLYAYVDGYEVSIVNANYSMVQYCDRQLKNTGISAELRTALSDLLIYGEMNQIYEGYKTDALCTSLLSANAVLTPSTFPAAGVDASWNVQGMSGTKLDDCTFTGVGVTLGAKIVIGLNVTCTDIQRFSFKVTIGDMTYDVAGSDLVPTGAANKYVLNFDKITAIQLGETITFTIWEGDTQVSRTATYSVYSYIYKNQNTADVNMANLLKAIYNYGEAVKAL